MAFAKANGINLKPFAIVTIASEAEREYIGLNNGLLDEACIALGKKGGLLFLDCDSNEWRIIRRNPRMSEFEIGIIFSGLTRSLVNSGYNLRAYECKTAAWNTLTYQNAPLKTFDKTFLRDIPKETIDNTRDMMPLRFAKRAEHFYSECRRVRQGVTSWENGNLAHYLCDHTTMYAWPMAGTGENLRFDIGSIDTCYEACEKYGVPGDCGEGGLPKRSAGQER